MPVNPFQEAIDRANTSERVRQAIGAALDYPCAEQAFRLADEIEERVTEDDPAPESTRFEVAAEIADDIVANLSTLNLAILWAILGADGAGNEPGYDGGDTRDRIALDVFTLVESATYAALTAYAEGN